MRSFFARFGLCILFLSLLSGCSGCAKKIKSLVSGSCFPNSEIPEKREFPVDESAKPCDDFYAYACNKALSCFELREDRSRHLLAIHDSVERLLRKKQEYMKNLGSASGLSERAQMMKDTYLACMDGESRKGEEKALVASTLKEVSELKDRAAFLSYLGDHVTSPDYAFVDFGRIANLDNSNWYDVYIDSETLRSLPDNSYYDKKEVVTDFQALIAEFFKTVELDNPEKRAKNVIDFENEFRKTYPEPAKIRELITKRLYISNANLLSQYPNLKVAGLLNQLPSRTKMRFIFKENFAYLNKALATLPLEQLKDVYLFQSLSSYLDDAYPKYYEKAFAFRNKHLGGPPKRPERQERCTKLVMGTFTKELDAELIDKYFPDFPVERFENLVEKVRTAMIARLEKNTWLSAKGKAGALKKMKATKMQLVKPKTEEEWDFQLLAKYNPKAPIANRRLRSEKRTEKVMAEFKKPRNRKAWSMGPMTVNAYYSPSDNKFVMLQGILQYPFFDVGSSDAANLGGVGMVVGHELGHAIDDKGAKFGPNGELKTWMSKEDLKKFADQGKILIDQYANADPKHNGELTLGENIADVTGLSFGYSAAFPNNEGSLEDKKAFFLQYARLWCGTMRPAELQRLLKTDPHSQTNVRVNEPLKHQSGFYEAYGCKAGDKMHLPEDKRLSIW